METSTDPPLKVADLAHELDVHRTTLYRAVRSGALAAIRVGEGRGVIRISRAEANDYIRRCREAATRARRSGNR